jgi:hypothetical protein
MSHAMPHCKDDFRRELVRRHTNKWRQHNLNGLDYVEVDDDQVTLTVYFLGRLPRQLRQDKPSLTQYVRVEGGRRIRDIQVVDVDPHDAPDPDRDDFMVVRLNKPGDFSTYTLRLVGIPNVDPRYDHVEFTFKVNCPSELDCAVGPACPPEKRNEPEINYLAKDYASFRQLILDRLALIMPDWKERHVPDLGIALVEVLAYTGDYLSYYQDAVATEAYLDTARQRISVRRHARLVDYLMHEGCNARAWVHIATPADYVGEKALDPQQLYFITGLNDAHQLHRPVVTEDDLRQLPAGSYEAFEPLMRAAGGKIELRAAHNKIRFYAWGNRECCLPEGSTSATLEDAWLYASDTPEPYPSPAAKQAGQAQTGESPPLDPARLSRRLHLKAGDVLIFEEVRGPKTGQKADADPTRRHVVRLTKVTEHTDIVVNAPVLDAETCWPLRWDGVRVMQPTPVVEIEWDAADALPFPLCLSSIARDAPEPCSYVDHVSVARGNVILVDHGLTQPPEALGKVDVLDQQLTCECAGEPSETLLLPRPFRPALAKAPLTFGVRPLSDGPAAGALGQDPRAAMPQAHLSEISPAPDGLPLFDPEDLTDARALIRALNDRDNPRAAYLLDRLTARTRRDIRELKDVDAPPGELVRRVQAELTAMLRAWEPRFDLLGSGPDDRHFVVEMDNEGIAHLRFGDDELGEMPDVGAAFLATYRTGNGARGNVGADAISHLVVRGGLPGEGILAVRNPMAAQGGTDAEPMNEVKLFAPSAFRKQLKRAITAEDYAALAQRDNAEVQRAAAQLAWTGSWYEADVAIDARGTEEPGQALLDDIESGLFKYRRIGHDVDVQAARYVPLDVAITICVQDNYLRGHVKAALLDVFRSGLRADGTPGFFHPDKLTFGEGIYVSQLVAAAKAVPGVENVSVTKLQRLFEAANQELENGLLPLGPMEVARLDNDPSFPENGRLTLNVTGGR